jgi:hypothetical protein
MKHLRITFLPFLFRTVELIAALRLRRRWSEIPQGSPVPAVIGISERIPRSIIHLPGSPHWGTV